MAIKMSIWGFDINNNLRYDICFANFGGTYGDDEVAILDVVDKTTGETIANTMKSVLEKVSADPQQREAQLRQEFDLLVYQLTDGDWRMVANYDDEEWAICHRIMYALTHPRYEDNTPF
jgi:hypothetical protein